MISVVESITANHIEVRILYTYFYSLQYLQVSEMETVSSLSLPLKSTELTIWIVSKYKPEALKHKTNGK